MEVEGGEAFLAAVSRPGCRVMLLKRGEKVVGAFASEADPDHPLAEMGREIGVSPLLLVYLLLLTRLCPGGRGMLWGSEGVWLPVPGPPWRSVTAWNQGPQLGR